MFQVFQMTKGESSDELVLGDPSPHDEARKVKRRNRVLQSCIPCHELRRKCDRQRPCTRCSEHGVAGQCVYQLEDPAARQEPNQDELSRLRRRVAELEHTVRVLTQRASPRELEEKVLAGSSRVQGSADDDETRRKRGPGSEARSQSGSSSHSTATSSGINIPQSYPGRGQGLLLGQSISGSPRGSSGGNIASNIPHCGCAMSVAGREILGQLQNNLSGSIQRLKALPEHQRHGVNCPLYSQVMHLHEHIRQSTGGGHGGSSHQQPAYTTSVPMSSYGLQSPYAPTSSSHSSSSPPQASHDFIGSFDQGPSQFDLGSPLDQPSQPYPYTASHSSTLSHSLSHPQLGSSLSHPQSYTQAAMPSMGSVGGSFQQYQPQSTSQSSHQASGAGSSQQSGLPGSVPFSGYTSLSTWNSVPGSTQQQQQQQPQLLRRASKSVRPSGAPRPAK